MGEEKNKKVPTAVELLARVYPISSSGLERRRHPLATDLSRVIPKRSEEEKNNTTEEIKSR